ncbi:MAG: acyl-CoA dehydrogenase family protein [Desulfobacterales bacterium]
MNFELSKQHKMLQQAVQEFAGRQIAPVSQHGMRTIISPMKKPSNPWANWVFSACAFGGVRRENLDWLSAVICDRRNCKSIQLPAVQVNMQCIGSAYTIYRYGNETLKQKYIKKLVTAEYLGGFAITEPDAGSDVMGMASEAEDRGDHWLLNGSKTWFQCGYCGCPDLLCVHG